jgi:hypothetical protein
LLDRDLMRLGANAVLPRLFFHGAGLAALQAMMADRRFADPPSSPMSARNLALIPWWVRFRVG